MNPRILIFCLVLFSLMAPLVIVNAVDGPEIQWWTVDSGGGACSGGGFTLNGVTGQPDAGVMSGGEYVLSGGYLAGGQVQQPHLYQVILTLILKNWIPNQ